MHLLTSRLILSIEAISWVFKQDIQPASLKFVLVALANFTNADGNFWPSIAAIAAITSQNRKTIIQSISKLEELGIIIDTQKRVGSTGQIKVYCLNKTNDTKDGTLQLIDETVPNTEQLNSTVFTSNSTVFTRKSTENGTRNLKEPFKNLASCEPKETTQEILPAEWCSAAEKNGIPEEQIYRSWSRFKKISGFPFQRDRWLAWIIKERVKK